MVTEVKEEHPDNALYPIEVTEFGILIEVKEWQCLNAELLISFTFLPN